MGILNVTPDSFSDGGQFVEPEVAINHAKTMLDDGADVIDVGGESTRPVSAPVERDTEMERVIPVVEALSGRCRIAVDTRHEEVARAAVAAGATIINDVSAELWSVAAELGVGWIAMHMQGAPNTMQRNPSYNNVVVDVRDYLVDRAASATEAGVTELWIDPGFGFGKTFEHNLTLLAGIDSFVETGYRVAIGTSRKAMLGQMLARSDGADQQIPPEGRLVGSVATATYAMLKGASLVRVHDVKAAKQAATVVAGER